jgi:hypothetical protein
MKYTKKNFESVAMDIRTNVMPSLRQAVCNRWVKAFKENPLFKEELFRAACEVPQKVNRKVITCEKIVTDFNNWNSISNRYGLKCVDKDMELPVGLVDAAIKDFESWCETFHVDSTQYKYIRVSGGEVTWQIDFHDDLDETGIHVCMYEIYYNEENMSIMQRCISME